MRFIKKMLRFCLDYFYIFIGFFAYNSESFRRKRRDEFGIVGKNYIEELKKSSRFLYILEKGYHAYFIFKNRKLDNSKWESIRWEDYAPIYYRSRVGEPLDELFCKYFRDAGKHYNVKRVLDIGCGPWVMAREVAKLSSGLNITGIDISEQSQSIFNEISGDYPNFEFIKGNMLDHLALLDKTDLFYSYNVFMHFEESEMRRFFDYFSRTGKKIFGIFQEPYSDSAITRIYKQRDYCHNFSEYFKLYNLKELGAVKRDKNYGTFYVTNTP